MSTIIIMVTVIVILLLWVCDCLAINVINHGSVFWPEAVANHTAWFRGEQVIILPQVGNLSSYVYFDSTYGGVIQVVPFESDLPRWNEYSRIDRGALRKETYHSNGTKSEVIRTIVGKDPRVNAQGEHKLSRRNGVTFWIGFTGCNAIACWSNVPSMSLNGDSSSAYIWFGTSDAANSGLEWWYAEGDYLEGPCTFKKFYTRVWYNKVQVDWTPRAEYRMYIANNANCGSFTNCWCKQQCSRCW